MSAEIPGKGSSGLQIQVNSQAPPWCADGRPDFCSTKGPQMLGGSIHPILLSAIYAGRDFDSKVVRTGINQLRAAGKAIGVHRGEYKRPTQDLDVPFFDLKKNEFSVFSADDHKKYGITLPDTVTGEEHILPVNAHMDRVKGTSDCGFADRTEEVIAKALDNRSEITRRLTEGYDANRDKFGDIPFGEMVANAYSRLESWDMHKNRVKVSGESLISMFESFKGNVVEVEGKHAEQTARINLVKGQTYDTQAANNQGRQDFNLDLPEVVEQAEILGVPAEFGTALSVILYQATEMVLVEEKGKDPLPIVVYA